MSRSKVSSCEIEMRPVAELATDLAAQHVLQVVVGEGRDLADLLDPEGDEPLLGARADAGEDPDRERREECRLAAGADDGQAAGLAAVGGDLRDDLRRRDAERARQTRSRAKAGAISPRSR